MNKLIALAINENDAELELMIHNELLELKKRKVRKILEQEYILENIDTFSTKLKKIEDSNKEKLKLKMAKEHNNGYMWVTINPKPDVGLADFCKFLAKISTKTCFADVLYTLEQRGSSKSSLGKGFHAHLLIKRNLKYKPFKLKQNIKYSCKKIVGNINNDSQLNIQVVGEDYAKDKKDYILGIKHGDGKQAKQQYDPIWRSENGIQNFYGNKNII